MNAVVDVRRTDNVLWLRLNRPERRNAINDELLTALDSAIAAAEIDEDVDAVVLAGRGAAFCSGADLRHLLAIADRPGEPTAFLAGVSAVVSRIERCSKPVVAALHGYAVAGGLELALACDVVVAAEGTLIGDGHLRHRLLPAAGSSVRLPRKVGPGLARLLMLSGQLMPAERFLASGWIASVVPPDELEEAADSLARDLAEVASAAQRNLKALLSDLEELGPMAGLELELQAFAANWTESDVPSALEAFLAARSTLDAQGA